MRTLSRNQSWVYYALNEGEQMVKDQDGYFTGEHRVIYSKPKALNIHVSASKGKYVQDLFGQFANYDKVMVTNNLELPIEESTVFWIDDLDPESPHDYEITRISKSINVMAIAVKKVEVGR